MNKNISKHYGAIQDYIKKCDYTYDVVDILEYYEDYYLKGHYIAFTMRDCINNLEEHIRIILGLESEDEKL